MGKNEDMNSNHVQHCENSPPVTEQNISSNGNGNLGNDGLQSKASIVDDWKLNGSPSSCSIQGIKQGLKESENDNGVESNPLRKSLIEALRSISTPTNPRLYKSGTRSMLSSSQSLPLLLETTSLGQNCELETSIVTHSQVSDLSPVQDLEVEYHADLDEEKDTNDLDIRNTDVEHPGRDEEYIVMHGTTFEYLTNKSEVLPNFDECSNNIRSDRSYSELSDILSVFELEAEYYADLDSEETCGSKPGTPLSLYDDISLNAPKPVTCTDETDCEYEGSSTSVERNKTYIWHKSIRIPTLNLENMSSVISTSSDDNSNKDCYVDCYGQGVKIYCEKENSIYYFLLMPSFRFHENSGSVSCSRSVAKINKRNVRSSAIFSPSPDPTTYCLNIPGEPISCENEAQPSFFTFSRSLVDEEREVRNTEYCISSSLSRQFATSNLAVPKHFNVLAKSSELCEQETQPCITIHEDSTAFLSKHRGHHPLQKKFKKSCLLLKSCYPHYYQYLYSKYEIVREEDLQEQRINDENVNSKGYIAPCEIQAPKSSELIRKTSKRNYFGLRTNPDDSVGICQVTCGFEKESKEERAMMDIILTSKKKQSQLFEFEKFFEKTGKM